MGILPVVGYKTSVFRMENNSGISLRSAPSLTKKTGYAWHHDDGRVCLPPDRCL